MRRTADVIRAIAAALASALLVLGLPALLISSVGWPLPRQLPTISGIADTITGSQPLDSATVWKILAVILWVAWLQVLVAFVIEVVSVVRGSLPRSLPGLHLAHGLVGPLVAAIVLVWPLSAAPRAAATPLASSAPRPRTPAPSAAPAPIERSSAQTPTTTAVTEHTVVRRDTLWDLAERYLGDGYRAPEIFELNRGRPQPDGASLTDPSLIRPGWILQIPTPAAATPAVDAVTVQPGDTLWGIASRELGDGDRYRALYDLNTGIIQPDGRALTNAAVIRPGWQLRVPSPDPQITAAPDQPRTPDPVPPAAPPATPRPQSPATPPVTDPADVPPTPPVTANERPAAAHDGSSPGAGALGVAGTMLAAGLAAAVGVRRRRRSAERPAGLELPPLPADTAPLVEEIATSDTDTAARVASTIGHLGETLATRASIPAPLVASVDGDYLELLLDRQDADAPAGWSTDARGWIWRAPLHPTAGAYAVTWTPAFVSIGGSHDGGLLVNLEALGSVGLVGDGAITKELAASITTELTMGILARGTIVHCVDGALAATLPTAALRVHDTLDAAIAAARAETATVRQALEATNAEHVFALRCRADDDPWPPTVIVTPYDAGDTDTIAELVAISGPQTGLTTVMVGGCSPASTEIRVTDTEVSVPALGLVCAPQRLDVAAMERIGDLIAAADEPAAPPRPEPATSLFDDPPAPTDAPAETATVRVRVLGPITVDGADLKPQQVAVLAYLALHPDATADALRDAVWAGRPPTRERFLNTMHELRRAVGGDVLPASVDGRYHVQGITCDALEFRRLANAASDDQSDAAAQLRAALKLVTGPPLTYDSRHRRHYTWVDLGNHANRWERIVCDTAHDLATAAITAGDHDLARWAAERGLAASPTSELSTCDLVAAHLAAGDRRAAERTADAYARLLEDLGLDEPNAVYDLLETQRAS